MVGGNYAEGRAGRIMINLGYIFPFQASNCHQSKTTYNHEKRQKRTSGKREEIKANILYFGKKKSNSPKVYLVGLENGISIEKSFLDFGTGNCCHYGYFGN